MSKELVIVESPAKARTIGRILPGSYTVTASMGHIRDLPTRKLGVDIKNNFEPKYEVAATRKKVIQELKDAAKNADAIYLATDPDREGEAIAWHIYELLKGQAKDAVFRRVTFHEITRSAVQEAFDHPGELNMDRVNAQQARRVLDRIVGYQVSPLLWKKVERGTSAGRVQSVALRLICEREKEIQGFTPEEYWNLVGHFNKAGDDGDAFEARLLRLDDDKVDINNQEFAESVASDAEKGTFAVDEVKKTPRKRRPSPPFITSTLQQAASSNLRFSPDFSMRIAQQLYEGIATDSGEPSGLITYMRTDSVSVSKDAQSAARAFAGKEFGDDYVPKKPNNYRSRGGAQEAHEAIRPTDVNLTPERAKRFLDEPQLKLYTLIWNRFLASQMAPAQQLRYSIDIINTNVGGDNGCTHSFLFRATTTITTFPGFLRVYNLKDVEEEDEEEFNLPELKKDDGCLLKELERQQKFTEPPPRFSEAMLVRELEKNGIGRPSTYASIIRTIFQQRNYVEKEKGKLMPTRLGFRVNDYLITSMPQLFEVDFTARMEGQLDDVESGSREWHDMLGDFYTRFSDWLENAKFDGPGDEVIKTLLDAFPKDLKWDKPVKRRGKSFDDKEFYQSFYEQLEDEKGKEFSGRQWEVLLQMAIKYEKQPGFPDLKSLYPDNDEIHQQIDTFREKQAEIEAEEPREETLELMAALDKVEKWEEPVTRGKRTYDDKAFVNSLKEDRTNRGRMLTPNQLKYLRRLIVKYKDQIASYDSLRDKYELPPEPKTADLSKEKIDKVFAMTDEIKAWEEPRGKGKRKFDPKDFVASLRDQHDRGSQLSDRQWNALQKVLSQHAEQIDDFESRAKDFGLEKALPEKPKKTGVTCPKCGKGELVERSYRRRTFYGCEKYPKCDYSTRSLDKVAEEEESKGS